MSQMAKVKTLIEFKRLKLFSMEKLTKSGPSLFVQLSIVFDLSPLKA